MLLIILALFVAAVSFVIPSSSKYHGDERFYTDAALRMCDTGDYWTPYFASGKIRLLKPIAAYWGIVASFKTFGVSLVTSRLPSVAASALTLVVVYWLGRTVFKSPRIGLMAAAMLGSNIEFLTLSARATPDAMVTLFCAVAMLGFAKVWFGDGRPLAGALLAWCGMGLAVQTKGLLGLCPLAANLIFVLLARPGGWQERVRKLLDWRAVSLGLVLALFWYVAMVRSHGAGALRDFFDDQVGAKVSMNPGYVLQNLATYFFAGIRHFLPWTLLLFGGAFFCRKQMLEFWRSHKAECLFLLALFPLLVVGFSFGNMRTSRYMIVSYPALAILIAASVNLFWNASRLQLILGRVILAFGIVLLAMAGGLYAWGGALSWRIIAAAAVLAAAGAAALVVSKARYDLARWCWIGSLMIAFYATFDGGIRTLSTPTPFSMIAQNLLRLAPPEATVITYKVEEAAAALVRLESGARLKIRPVQKEDFERDSSVILTTIEGRNAELLADYRFEEVSLGPEALRIKEALQKHRRAERGRSSSRRNVQYFIGIKGHPAQPNPS